MCYERDVCGPYYVSLDDVILAAHSIHSQSNEFTVRFNHNSQSIVCLDTHQD